MEVSHHTLQYVITNFISPTERDLLYSSLKNIGYEKTEKANLRSLLHHISQHHIYVALEKRISNGQATIGFSENAFSILPPPATLFSTNYKLDFTPITELQRDCSTIYQSIQRIANHSNTTPTPSEIIIFNSLQDELNIIQKIHSYNMKYHIFEKCLNPLLETLVWPSIKYIIEPNSNNLKVISGYEPVGNKMGTKISGLSKTQEIESDKLDKVGIFLTTMIEYFSGMARGYIQSGVSSAEKLYNLCLIQYCKDTEFVSLEILKKRQTDLSYIAHLKNSLERNAPKSTLESIIKPNGPFALTVNLESDVVKRFIESINQNSSLIRREANELKMSKDHFPDIDGPITWK